MNEQQNNTVRCVEKLKARLRGGYMTFVCGFQKFTPLSCRRTYASLEYFFSDILYTNARPRQWTRDEIERKVLSIASRFIFAGYVSIQMNSKAENNVSMYILWIIL